MPHRKRELPGTRDPDDVDIVKRRSMLDQCVEGTVDERAGDSFVEAAGDYRNTPVRTGGSAREFSHSGRQQVAELVPLRVEIAGILLRRGGHDRNPVLYLQTVPLEPDELPRIVCQRPDAAQTE